MSLGGTRVPAAPTPTWTVKSTWGVTATFRSPEAEKWLSTEMVGDEASRRMVLLSKVIVTGSAERV